MNKICFLICGLPRAIDMIITNIENIFDKNKYSIHFYICSSFTYSNEDSYCNKTDLNLLMQQNNNIKKLLIIEDYDCVAFRNVRNYTNKITNGLNIIEAKYDIYCIIRSDCIINNIEFMQNVVDKNKLYFSNEVKNPFTKHVNEKINEHIIISKSYELIQKMIAFHNFCYENDNYCDINLHKFVKLNNLPIELLSIDYKLVLFKCNIIAISGDSGSGKSSLMEHLLKLYDSNVLKLETDRYHKWERGNESYKHTTHLNPIANYLELMSEDVYNLKIGNEIYQVDYDHTTGKFTDKSKINSKNNILLCGLHTLYMNKLNKIIDIKIYMDTDRELIKKWKIKRDTEERKHSIDKILAQIEHRNKDYFEYIHNQKNNADIIINFYETPESILKCNFIIANKDIFNNLSVYFFKYNYSVKINENLYIIDLKNEYDTMMLGEHIQIDILTLTENLNNRYYNEILIFLYLTTFGKK